MKRRTFLKTLVGGAIGALLPASFVANVANATGMTLAQMRAAAASLKANAVRGPFVAVIHPSMTAEIWSKKLFEEVREESYMAKFMGEVGEYNGVSIITTESIKMRRAIKF